MSTGFGETRESKYRNMVMENRGHAGDISTDTASSGAVTMNAERGIVTTESLTTAQNAIYTLTLTNSRIAADDLVKVTVGNGTNTQGSPMLGTVTPAAGSVVILVHNKHATSEALNGTLKIGFEVVKALSGL